MKKRLHMGGYLLGAYLLTVIISLLIPVVTVKANELPDENKIKVNISITVPQDFSGELRIRYSDMIGSLPDHIFILSERSNYNINVSMLPGKYAYKSTEINGSLMDVEVYEITMPDITIVNDIRSNKEFKGELIRIKEELPAVNTGDLTTNEEKEQGEENKYFGTMTEKEIFEWYKEQIEQIISEDNEYPELHKLTNVEWMTADLLHFCSYSMKNKIKNTDDLMKIIETVSWAKSKGKDTDLYKTVAKTFFYVYEEWQKGNQVDFVFEEEESNEINEEYISLIDDLIDFGNTNNTNIIDNDKASDNNFDEDIEDISVSDGLILDDNAIDSSNGPNNTSIETNTAIKDEANEEQKKNNPFISFLKKGGFSFVIVLVVGVVWIIIKIIKRKTNN